MPKYSILISTNSPELRSIAHVAIFSRLYSISHKSPEFRKSTALHMAGSWHILRQVVQTFCALPRMSIAPSLCSTIPIRSVGRSTQFGCVCAVSISGSGWCGSELEVDAILLDKFSRKIRWNFQGFSNLYGCSLGRKAKKNSLLLF